MDDVDLSRVLVRTKSARHSRSRHRLTSAILSENEMRRFRPKSV